MKFRVITSSIVPTGYIVEAKNADEAENQFDEGNYTEANHLSDYELDSNEEVLEVQLKCPACDSGFMDSHWTETEKIWKCNDCPATIDSDGGLIK